MFRAVRDTGGVVGINLYLDFVGGGHMDDLIAHIEHFLSLSGESTVAIGGDLDGCETLAAGMTGVQDVAKLYQALEERGIPSRCWRIFSGTTGEEYCEVISHYIY